MTADRGGHTQSTYVDNSSESQTKPFGTLSEYLSGKADQQTERSAYLCRKYLSDGSVALLQGNRKALARALNQLTILADDGSADRSPTRSGLIALINAQRGYIGGLKASLSRTNRLLFEARSGVGTPGG